MTYERTQPLVVSMSVGGEFAVEGLTFDHWSRFAQDVRVDRTWVLDFVEQVAETAPRVMEKALGEVDDWYGSVAEVAQRLLPNVRAFARRMIDSTRPSSAARLP